MNLPSRAYKQEDILNCDLLKRYIMDFGYRHVMITDTERPDLFCFQWWDK